jgi:hypothetical protein
MDLIDQHRTFLYMDELEHGVRNPPTTCRKTRVADPGDYMVRQNDDGTWDFGNLQIGLDGDATKEKEETTSRQPGIVQIGRSPQIDTGWDGSAGVSQTFTAMKYPDFTSHSMVTWPGQNYEHFSTMWEGMHCPLINFNQRKGLTPVVDDCGLLVGHFHQGVSTNLLYSTEDGEIFYSNQYGNHINGMKAIGGEDLWLSAAGKVLTWSQKSQNLNAFDYSQMYHQKVKGGNKADILVDIDGYVMAIYTYLDPPPQPEPGFWDTPVGAFLGFMAPHVVSAECMPGGALDGDDECALEFAMMQMDFMFLFIDLMSLGSSKILRKAAMKLLTIGAKARRAAKLMKKAAEAGRLALKGGRATEKAGRLLLAAPSMRRPQLALPAPAKATAKAKPMVTAGSSNKKAVLGEISRKSGMTNMAVRDVRKKMIKHGVRIRFRPAGTARKLRKRGAVPKWEDLKMKTINDDDLLIGAPKAGRTQPGYFDPKLPDPKLKQTDPGRYEQVMKRYKQRKEEFEALKDKVEKMKKDGDIVVENGVVKHGPSGKEIAGDYDIYEILDKNGKRITDKDPRYNRIIDDLRGRRIGAQHGAHVEWKPKTDFEKKIYDDIIERHKTKEPLYEFREDGSIWETFAD